MGARADAGGVMRAKHERREPFIFTLISEFMPHDEASSGDVEPISDRAIYGLLAVAATVAGVVGWFRWVWLNE